MYKNLYEIQAEYEAIVTALLDADGELTPEMELALTINQDELQNKAESYALRILEFNGKAEIVAAEVKRLQAMQKSYTNTAEKLKQNISAAMLQFNIEKIKTDRVQLSFRKSEVVEIPETFLEDVLKFTTIKIELDKSKIDAAIAEAVEHKTESPIIPQQNVLDNIKIKAEFDKTKIKTAIKEGCTVGEIIIVDKKNLQIK